MHFVCANLPSCQLTMWHSCASVRVDNVYSYCHGPNLCRVQLYNNITNLWRGISSAHDWRLFRVSVSMLITSRRVMGSQAVRLFLMPPWQSKLQPSAARMLSKPLESAGRHAVRCRVIICMWARIKEHCWGCFARDIGWNTPFPELMWKRQTWWEAAADWLAFRVSYGRLQFSSDSMIHFTFDKILKILHFRSVCRKGLPVLFKLTDRHWKGWLINWN